MGLCLELAELFDLLTELTTGDRIFATGSGSVSKIVLRSCGCFSLISFRTYNHGLKGPSNAQNILRYKQFCDPVFHPYSYCWVGTRVATGSCDPVSRRAPPRQHLPTTTELYSSQTYLQPSPMHSHLHDFGLNSLLRIAVTHPWAWLVLASLTMCRVCW